MTLKFEQTGLACRPEPSHDYRAHWMKDGLSIPQAGHNIGGKTPNAELTRAQLDAEYSRDASGRRVE